VGGVGGAESTEARWSWRGWRRGEIDGQAVAGEQEHEEDDGGRSRAPPLA
jgi:hypothetical protein